MNKNCVNISSKEFKDLVKKYNISAANMEDVIHEYLLLNNTDEFPPDSYIELKFSGVRTEMSEYQLILWENRYSQPQVFDNINDFNKAKLEALRYFKPQAIVEYTDALGNYIFKVAYPDFEKEYQEILANAPRNSEGKLLAPNGKPSNLTERQYALVRSKAFKRWFGDWENNPENASKVIDGNGEPLVVYHTSPNKFNTFDINKFGSTTDSGQFGKGFYFGELNRGSGTNTYSVFLNIKNPYYINEKDSHTSIVAHTFNRVDTDELSYKLTEIDKKIINNADGVISLEDIEYVVKNPNQIKSAESNIGTFSRTNDNIYQEGEYNLENPKKDSRLIELSEKKEVSINDLIEIISLSEYNDIINILKELSIGKEKLLKDIKVKVINPLDYLSKATLIREKFKGRRAYYDADTNTIVIDATANFSNGDASSVILHEIMHHITVNRILSNPSLKEEFITLIKEYRKHYPNEYIGAIDKHYIEEFIADIWSNKNTIENLKKIKYKGEKHTTSLWNKMLKFFKNKLFKGAVKDSMFELASNLLIDTINTNIKEYSKDVFYDNQEINRQEFTLLLNDFNNATNNKNDAERFANILESELTISSEKTILSNEELKYWNELGVGEMPRILVASERTDPAFHVKDILDIINGEKTVPLWGVVNGKRAITDNLSGKDFAGLYLITKHDGLPMLKLLQTKIPKLLHFSITTLGGTLWEPGVMKYNDLLDKIEDYIKLGLDPNSVTIRIDPIVPGITKKEDIELVVKRAASMGIKRIRFSIMDAYTNTREAMTKLGYDFNTYYGKNFFAKDEYIEDISNFMLSLAGKYDITLGTCAENIAKKGISKEGCLSVAAVNNMLGTNIEDKGTDNNTLRKLCSCYGGKVDALAYAKTCASHCVYCYAKHENDKALQYYNEDGTLKDNVYTRTREELSKLGQEGEILISTEGYRKGDPYEERQQETARQLEALLNSNLMTNTEIREIADLMVYWISDHITELLEKPQLAEQIYGERLKSLDTLNMDRIDIVKAIGLDNILELCKLKFSPLNIGTTKISLLKKAKLITDNWLAVMQLANSTFAEIEKFSVLEEVVGDKVIKSTDTNLNENQDNFDNNQLNDEDTINEVQGNLLEHWQTKANTIDIMDSMSQMMRRAISHCYQLKEVDRDEDNKPIYDKIKSEFGINLRVKPREVTSQLLSWCKGALNINDVIQQLKEKETNNPWVSLIISRLEDLTGNETEFLSQFFGVFVKPFMTYSIIKKDAKTGQYISLIVNKNPALKEAVKSIVTLYKIGQNPMFLASGHINELTFKLFEQAKKELDNANFELNFDTIVKDLGYMYNALGYTVTSDIIKEILIDKLTFKTLYTQFNYIYASLAEYVDKEDISDYQPFKFKGEGNILGSLNKVLKPITDTLEDTMETSFYDSGNMYQSYVLPSYMTKLMNKFHLKGELFIKFINDEYAKYEWFKDKSARSIERGWKNEMLRELVNSEEARKIFDHKVLLNFNKHQYMRNMKDTECALAILSEYWSETSRAKSNITRVPAWFRVPMLSNKPSAEYIKFYSERGDNYKEVLTENLYKIFLLELGRILTVEMRGYNKSDPEFIKNFDKNGKKFNFLDFMNSYLTGTDKNSDLGKLIRKKLEGKKLSPELEIEFKNLVLEAIKASMNSKVESIMKNWREQGIVDAAKNIEGIDKNNIERELENFIWNDTYMSMNILELTITDKAYYKDEEDLQKRLALIHAPGIRGNEFATDYQGNRVSDGKLRTFYLKDFDNFISNITDNVDIVFNRRIKEAKEQDKSELEIKGLEALKDSLTRKPKTLGDEDKGGLFYQINVADALGYSSPTSYRKKAFLFGKWSKLAEDIYLKLITGNYTYSDLKTAFLPLKPFVYTLIEKSTNLSSNEGMTNIKVPILNKNSEYLLILADAILLGENTGKPNLLRAIYNIMEESATTTKEIILNNGKKQTIRTPRVDGIDTVLFESTVKSGLRGAIDINQFYNMENGEQEAKKYIESLIGKNGAYNETFVDAIHVEDYCLQLEVPAHFKDHELVHGSLIRAITPSDLLETYPDGSPVKYKVEGRELEANEFIKEYEDTIALNVEESINLLRNELKLTPNATRLDRNKALEKILRREILSSPRYGVDLLLACTLKNGEFTIPKGDPIQSKRVEQLLNSIIKNRINKLEIAGGPVVLVSNFGTSKELNIRFKDKNGNLLMTKEEYEKSHSKSANTTKTASSQSAKFAAKYSKIKPKTYKEYLEENQAGIAYFEVFAPIYLNDIFEKFQNPDGSVDIKAIEELNPDLLKMIGYRIPTEDKYSCAPLKIVGFLPREAGDAIMLPNDITLLTGSDFDIDKEYLMRKDIPITLRDFKDIKEDIFNELTKGKEYSKESLRALKSTIHDFVSNPDPKMMDFNKILDRILWQLYKKFAYKAEPPISGRTYRNNKIVDMTYEVLTHETVADKILNPGGFDQLKKMGYMIAAYKANNGYSWEELEEIGNSEDGISKLKDLCYTEKNLCFIDTHLQFYKQNNAAGSLIGTFAVHKVAHAILESDGFEVDIENSCPSFTIDGMEFKGVKTLDPRYDRKGNFIGKTLGSLVASAADAVKDPVLNLMNINSNTSNVLNTLIRLGMDFDTAALFLSLSSITEILKRFSIENISGHKSLNTVIKERIKELEQTYHIDNSLIEKEELSREEMIDGLATEGQVNPKIEYKVLKIFSNLQSIGNAVRSATLATRFNSISSAVGPLIIDNLITEYNIDNFTDKLLYQGQQCGIEKIFALHPYLEKFYDTLRLAKELMGNMPANSSGFRDLLNSARNYKEIFFKDRKLLSLLSDFYQSYILISSGVINSKHLNHYINDFPKYFFEKNYKEEYSDNALIQAIKLDTTEDGRAILKIDTTGMKQEDKDVLSSAWIDLHKKNPELSEWLFIYNFFRGGIGFNPKTFMLLVPTYVKERIPKYIDSYRHLPQVVNGLVLDLFIRNNWSNNKLVPLKKVALTVLPSNNQIFQVADANKIEEMREVLYFKTKDNNGKYTIWRQVHGGKEATIITYAKVSALGNNGEYLEISTDNINQSLSDLTINKLFEPSDNGIPESTDADLGLTVLETQQSNKYYELAILAFLTSPKITTKELALTKILEYKNKSKEEQKSLENNMRKFLNNALSKLNITVDETLVNKVYNKIC